jgi:hypothetical protein
MDRFEHGGDFGLLGRAGGHGLGGRAADATAAGTSITASRIEAFTTMRRA